MTHALTGANLPSFLIAAMGILGLLALPQNRNGKAWAIWLPLLVLGVFPPLLRSAGSMMPAPSVEFLVNAAQPVVFGLAVVWLTTLSRPGWHKLGYWSVAVSTLIGSSLLLLAVRLSLQPGAQVIYELTALAGLGSITLAALIGATVCGLGEYRPCRLMLGTVVGAFLGCAGLLVVVSSVQALSGGSGLSGPEVTVASIGLTLVTEVILLPFIVLSFWNGLYRERLKAMLGLGMVPPPRPPVIPTPVLPVEERAGVT